LKTSQRIRTVLSHACIYFTTASLALYTGGMLASGIEREWIPTLEMMYMVFCFSLLFSLANQTVLPSSLPGVLKLILHYAVTTLIFYVIFIVWGGFSKSPSTVLVILFAYTLVYAIGALVVFLVKYTTGNTKKNKISYEKQFGAKSADK